MITPLGLVLHDRLTSFVCTIGNYNHLKDVRTLHLHRIKSAELMNETAIVPEGFDLDKFIYGVAFGYCKSDETICMKALFEKDATIHFEETPLIG